MNKSSTKIYVYKWRYLQKPDHAAWKAPISSARKCSPFVYCCFCYLNI